jgi:hypothetical protein
MDHGRRRIAVGSDALDDAGRARGRGIALLLIMALLRYQGRMSREDAASVCGAQGMRRLQPSQGSMRAR